MRIGPDATCCSYRSMRSNSFAEWVGGRAAPELAALKFPLGPAQYESRAWFLPRAGEYWKAKNRLAAREASKPTG